MIHYKKFIVHKILINLQSHVMNFKCITAETKHSISGTFQKEITLSSASDTKLLFKAISDRLTAAEVLPSLPELL